MTAESSWPLPSQSPPIRRLLYLADGMIVGGGLTVLFLAIAGLLVLILPDLFQGDFSVGVSFALLILVLIAMRSVLFKVAHKYSPAQDPPPEARDWQETRRWERVAAVAATIGVSILGLSVALWGWWWTLLSPTVKLLLLTTAIVGITIRLYVFHRLGIRVL